MHEYDEPEYTFLGSGVVWTVATPGDMVISVHLSRADAEAAWSEYTTKMGDPCEARVQPSRFAPISIDEVP